MDGTLYNSGYACTVLSTSIYLYTIADRYLGLVSFVALYGDLEVRLLWDSVRDHRKTEPASRLLVAYEWNSL